MLNYALLKNPTNWVIVAVMLFLSVIFFNVVSAKIKGE